MPKQYVSTRGHLSYNRIHEYSKIAKAQEKDLKTTCTEDDSGTQEEMNKFSK